MFFFQLSNVWFDRYNITPDVPEHTETLKEIGIEVQHLIQNAMITEKLDLNRIVIGIYLFSRSMPYKIANL